MSMLLTFLRNEELERDPGDGWVGVLLGGGMPLVGLPLGGDTPGWWGAPGWRHPWMVGHPWVVGRPQVGVPLAGGVASSPCRSLMEEGFPSWMFRDEAERRGPGGVHSLQRKGQISEC